MFPGYSFLLRSSAIASILSCILLYPSCYSPERDLIQDPINTPLIHILDSAYERESGAVSIRWEYLGKAALHRVIILRRDKAGFDSIGVGNVTSQNSPDRAVETFLDSRPFSGELLEYSVTARTSRGLVDARAVQVQIPGARLLRLRRNPFSGRIQVDWQSTGNDITSFEVLRSDTDHQSSLALSGSDVDTFIDKDIFGNTQYNYRIVTTFSEGASLTSRNLFAQVYSLERTELVGSPGGRAVVASGSTVSSATMLALTENSVGLDIREYRYFFGASYDGSQSIGAIREETFPTGFSNISAESVDMSGPSSFLPPSTNERLFLVGRSADGASVVVRGFSLPNLSLVWDGPKAWALSDPTTPTLVAQGGNGLIYFSADRRIRAYTSDFFELASYDLPFIQPRDIVVDKDYLWAAIESEGRVVRTSVSNGLSPSLAWEDVDLEVLPGFSPTGLTFNRFEQLFVLDGPAKRVYIFDTDLSRLLSWSLPNEDFSNGGIALDGGTGNLIHVCSTNGIVYTYLP